MWVQDFRGPAGTPPDPEVWGHELGGGGWGDGQRQVNTGAVANAALDGRGHLVITARREADGTITSARLTTQGRLSASYGRVSARIQVPGGRGTWSAFWMLGTEHRRRRLAGVRRDRRDGARGRRPPAPTSPPGSTTTPSTGTTARSAGCSTGASTTG